MEKTMKNNQFWIVPDNSLRTHHFHVKVNNDFHTIVCGEFMTFEEFQEIYFSLKELKDAA